MKLLHTSDWHVGKTLRGVSRADEHRAVLREIAEIAREESVDLVIVAGDLFDSATPSPESEEIVYRALLDLASTDADVAVIAGNHDSPRRLRAVAPLLELGRVRLVAEPVAPDAGGVIRLTSRDGTGVCLAMLPFVSKRGIVRARDLMDHVAFENAQTYSARLQLVLDALCHGFGGDTVNILAAHAFVLGAAAGGGERSAHLVDEYAITAQSFPATIGYGALGHLHRPQRVPAPAPLHYCGSPLQLDFGETELTQQVNLVAIGPGTPADVTAVRLRSGRPLRTLKGTLDELAEAEPGDAYLRVIVRGPNRAGLADLVRDLLGDGVVAVQIEATDGAATAAPVDHRQRSPIELLDEYLAHVNVDDELVRALFAELLDAEHEADVSEALP
jgi:exonuclease SbcD